MAKTASIGASSKPAFIVPDDFSWDLSLFSIPNHYESDLDSVMIVRCLQRSHARSHSSLRACASLGRRSSALPRARVQPHGLVMDRIQKLAVDILHAYRFREEGTRLHMLCVLKGGHQFFSDLCNALKLLMLTDCTQPPLTFDFIRVKSYAGTESSGAEGTRIESIGVDLKALAGRHILLVEDIIDTGNTMARA